MKTIILKLSLILLLSISTSSAFAQGVFVIEKIDTVSVSKEKLLILTENFIADFWNTGVEFQKTIDTENNIIQVKSSTQIIRKILLNKMKFDYDYTVKIRLKDYKFKIEIVNVYCRQARQFSMSESNSMEIPKIQPFDGDTPNYKTKTGLGDGASKKQAIEIRDELKLYFEGIIDKYCQYLTTNSNNTEEIESDF